MAEIDFSTRRQAMVRDQIAARGIRSSLVLQAMAKVPREAFVPRDLERFAYEDGALEIGQGQTISQPYIVALMTETAALRGGETVLEIGTGSGYGAAVLSEIAAQVYSVERIRELADQAAARLAELGYDNAHVLHDDGTLGWPAFAPYDAIVVTAGGPEVPPSLKAQLKIGGRLVIPIGPRPRDQVLTLVTRISQDDYRVDDLEAVRFVPLVGQEGWGADDQPSSGSKPRGFMARALSDLSDPLI